MTSQTNEIEIGDQVRVSTMPFEPYHPNDPRDPYYSGRVVSVNPMTGVIVVRCTNLDHLLHHVDKERVEKL